MTLVALLSRLNAIGRIALVVALFLVSSAVHADENARQKPLDLYAPYTEEQVAKAVTAAINGRPASIMRTKAASPEQGTGWFVEYTRPSDDSLWRMQVVPHEQGGIHWRSWDKLATPQRWGRWRTHSLDETFRWYIDGTGVLVISGDFIGENRYRLADF